jgi:hypothetical protein
MPQPFCLSVTVLENIATSLPLRINPLVPCCSYKKDYVASLDKGNRVALRQVDLAVCAESEYTCLCVMMEENEKCDSASAAAKQIAFAKFLVLPYLMC